MNGPRTSAKARVRGVYSTALTRLLLDGGFQIVQPSLALEERFGLGEELETPDLDVYDRPDRQGVHVVGMDEATEAFASILRSLLEDVVLRRWAVAVEGIYKGLIKHVDPEHNLALVDIGPAVGRLRLGEAHVFESREIVVQVQEERLGARVPRLSSSIRIPGRYAILIPEGQIRISRKIRDHSARERLHDLGRELKSGWGVVWRTAAAGQPPEVLRRELDELEERWRAIRDGAERVEAPAALWEETRFIDVEFPALSKRRLDECRGSVVPTIEGHHFYKACGGEISSAVDMAERLLEVGRPLEEVEELFRRTAEARFPDEDSSIEIEHVKLDGRVLHLGRARIVALDRDNSSVKLCRVLRGGGVYDGLGTVREPGDLAVTETQMGEWCLKTTYSSEDGQYKGTYINLNTPVELYPWGIRYVDLEVDIVVKPGGEPMVVDEEGLDRAAEEGLITQALVEMVRTKVRELLEQPEEGTC